MPQPISGQTYTYALALETTFNTGVADEAAMIQLQCEDVDIERNAVHQVAWRNSGKRINDISDINANVIGSVPTAQLSMLAYEEVLDILMYGCLQYVVQGATPEFDKDFDIPETSELPDFTNDEGLFFTFVKKSEVASTSEKLSTCIVKQIDLELSQESGNGTGNLNVTAELISTGGYSRTANPSGTWTRHDLTEFFNFNNLALFQVGGNDCIPISFKMSLKNNAMPYNPVAGSGVWQDIGIGVPYELEFEVDIINDANARTAWAGLDTGAETLVQLTWGTIDTDGYLNIACRGSINKANPTQDDMASINMTFVGVNDNANTENAFLMTLVNSLDRSW